MASVSGLTVYPVKGARGIACDKARVSSTGFVWDRNWVIVRNDKFESQRKDAKMALIKTSLPDELVANGLEADTEADLTISVPDQEPIKIPLGPGRSTAKRTCSVWEWTGDGFDEGDLAAEYLSDFMGHGVRLVRYAGKPDQGTPETAAERRALDANFAPKNTETAFSDAMPFLIANEASLLDLNEKCPEDIPMSRFRPNIVVNGPRAWDEDSWDSLRIGSLDFSATMPTGRCTVTTVDQDTAEVSSKKEPLRTLGTFRRGKDIGFTADPTWKNGIFFGWYFIAPQDGSVSVNDSVDILKRRDGPPGFWGAS